MVDKIDQLKIDSTAYDIDLPVDNIVKTSTVYSLMSPSSVSGSSTSGSYLSVRWYVSNKTGEFTTPYNGMKVAIKVPRAGVATAGVVLSINGNTAAEYHPVAYNVNTVLTSHYAANTVKILTYDASATMDCYLTSNTKSTITGVWKAEGNYVDGNTDTKVRQYQSGTTGRSGTQYPILTRYVTTDKTDSYDTNYARYHTNTYIDTGTGNIYAPNLGTAASKNWMASVEDGATDLVTSGAVYNALQNVGGGVVSYTIYPGKTSVTSDDFEYNTVYKLDGTQIASMSALNTYLDGRTNYNASFTSANDEIAMPTSDMPESYIICNKVGAAGLWIITENDFYNINIGTMFYNSNSGYDRYFNGYYQVDDIVGPAFKVIQAKDPNAGGGGSSDIFWCTYGTTTLAQIGEAWNAGKLVVCKFTYGTAQSLGVCNFYNASYGARFWGSHNVTTYLVTAFVNTSNSWSVSQQNIGCLSGDTVIDMYDGTTKLMKDIQIGDSVKSYNPATKEMCEGIVLEVLQQGMEDNYQYHAFSNGSVLAVANEHCFLSMEDGKEYPLSTIDMKAGDKFLDANGEIVEYVGQVAHNQLDEKTPYYNLLISNHIYFANGIATGYIPEWRNDVFTKVVYKQIPEALAENFKLGYAFKNSQKYLENPDYVQEVISKTLVTSRKLEEERKDLILKLADSDYKVIKAVEQSTLPPQEEMELRQSYRDRINEIDAQRDALYEVDCALRNKYYRMQDPADLELYDEIGFNPIYTEYKNNLHKEFVYVCNKDNEALELYRQYFHK